MSDTNTRLGPLCQPIKAEPGQVWASNLHPRCGGIDCDCECHPVKCEGLPDPGDSSDG